MNGDLPACCMRLSSVEVAWLSRQVTKDAIIITIHSLSKHRASIPKGFRPHSITSYWDTINDNVIQIVPKVFEIGSIPGNWKETSVVFVPKVQCP